MQPSDKFDLSPEQNTWAAACHEAAHAEVGHAAGGYLTRVSLKEKATYFEWPVPPRRNGYILMLLAGYVADGLAIPNCWAAPGVTAKAGAELAIASLEGGPMPSAHNDTWLAAAERYIKLSAAKAETIVRNHWPQIEAVATSLLVRGELSRDEFLAISR